MTGRLRPRSHPLLGPGHRTARAIACPPLENTGRQVSPADIVRHGVDHAHRLEPVVPLASRVLVPTGARGLSYPNPLALDLRDPGRGSSDEPRRTETISAHRQLNRREGGGITPIPGKQDQLITPMVKALWLHLPVANECTSATGFCTGQALVDQYAVAVLRSRSFAQQ
jgi:hypothetical protein